MHTPNRVHSCSAPSGPVGRSIRASPGSPPWRRAVPSTMALTASVNWCRVSGARTRRPRWPQMPAKSCSHTSAVASSPVVSASRILLRWPVGAVVSASTHTPTHSDQSRVSSRARMLASPPTRVSSRSDRSRASGDVRSHASSSGASAPSVRSSSPDASAFAAIDSSTSARNSSWFSQTLRMTDALVRRTPVVAARWSKTRRNVSSPAPTARPSSSRIARPAPRSSPRSSSRLRLVRRVSRACAIAPSSQRWGRGGIRGS